MIDLKQSKVLARTSRMAAGGDETIPRLHAEAVQEVVIASGL